MTPLTLPAITLITLPIFAAKSCERCLFFLFPICHIPFLINPPQPGFCSHYFTPIIATNVPNDLLLASQLLVLLLLNLPVTVDSVNCSLLLEKKTFNLAFRITHSSDFYPTLFDCSFLVSCFGFPLSTS